MSGDTGLRETIPAALDGERLDRVVALLGDVSRSRASAALKAERAAASSSQKDDQSLTDFLREYSGIQ